MKDRFMPTIEFHGPAATHDMPCCVDYLAGEPAVLNTNTGVFGPSWAARRRGWRLVRADTVFQRWILRTFFKDRQ